jgi:hypothetical protein
MLDEHQKLHLRCSPIDGVVAGGDDFTTLSPNSRLETFEIDTRRRQLALNGGERSNARD